MNDAQFRLSTGTNGEQPTVTATGEIDLANVNEFQDAMTKAATASRSIIVDMSEVTYCDSAAVRALFTVAADTGLTLMVRTSGPLLTLLGVSGLDRIATVTTVD